MNTEKIFEQLYIYKWRKVKRKDFYFTWTGKIMASVGKLVIQNVIPEGTSKPMKSYVKRFPQNCYE